MNVRERTRIEVDFCWCMVKMGRVGQDSVTHSPGARAQAPSQCVLQRRGCRVQRSRNKNLLLHTCTSLLEKTWTEIAAISGLQLQVEPITCLLRLAQERLLPRPYLAAAACPATVLAGTFRPCVAPPNHLPCLQYSCQGRKWS